MAERIELGEVYQLEWRDVDLETGTVRGAVQ